MTDDRLAEIKNSNGKLRAQARADVVREELVEALESERARWNWYFNRPIANYNEILEGVDWLERKKWTPDRWRIAIDSARQRSDRE